MIDQIVNAITTGEPLDMDSPELSAALEDETFRKEMMMAVGEAMGFADQINFDEPQAAAVVESADSAREFINGMMAMSAFADMADEELVAAAGPLESTPHSYAAPTNCSTDELIVGLETASHCFFIDSCFSGTASIAGDLTTIPNAEFAEMKVTWNDVPPLDPDDPFAGGRVSDGQYEERVTLANEDDEPRTLTGRATITVPIQFDAATFAANEIDTGKPAGSTSVTLQRCDNDCVGVKIEGLEGGVDPVVVASDADGQRLGSSESMSMRRDGWTGNTRFKGTVASVTVLIPTESATLEVDIVATKEPEWDGENYGPAAASRYDKPTPEPKFTTLTSADLAAGVEVVAGRLGSVFEFNHPSLHCHLPRVDNSHFAIVEFDDATVHDANGQPMEHEKSGRGYDPDHHCAQVSFESLESSEPIPLASIKGNVRIDYPLRIEMITLTADAPEQAGFKVSFDGPMVSITLPEELEYSDDDSPFGADWVGSSSIFDKLSRIHVSNDTGRPLKKLSYSGMRNGERYSAYWGNPTQVRLLRVIAWETINISYDLPPAPVLDDEFAGVDGPHKQCRS